MSAVIFPRLNGLALCLDVQVSVGDRSPAKSASASAAVNWNSTVLVKSGDGQWPYLTSTKYGAGETGRAASVLSVRKKLSFGSEEEEEDGDDDDGGGGGGGGGCLSSKSWYRCSSPESDWLQSGDIDLEISENEDETAPLEQQQHSSVVPIHLNGHQLGDFSNVSQGKDSQRNNTFTCSLGTQMTSVVVETQSPENFFWSLLFIYIFFSGFFCWAITVDVGRVYDPKKVQKYVSEAEQMVSGAEGAVGNGLANGRAGKANKKNKKHHYSREELGNSECDASSELTSGESNDEEVRDAPPPAANGSQILNRTFLLPTTQETAAAATACLLPAVDHSTVTLRPKKSDKMKTVRPWSLSGVVPVADDGSPWTPLSASETALNHLSCGSSSTGLRQSVSRPLMSKTDASTQKDMLSPSMETVLASSATALSSSGSGVASGSGGGVGGSSSGAVDRRRRRSTRSRNLRTRRSELDTPGHSAGSDNNLTLQNRLSASAASSSSVSDASDDDGALSGANAVGRRVMKSSTLTQFSAAGSANEASGCNLSRDQCRCSPCNDEVASTVGPLVFKISPHKAPSTLSTPRSLASDGEHYSLGLGHTDETSNSEQAWDNYVVRKSAPLRQMNQSSNE